MQYTFNLDVANRYGVDGAIIIHNLHYWISKNKANDKHFYEGKYWTYNSIRAFTEMFPFWTRRQIERILKNIIEKGAVEKGNFNRSNYDRTTWYALTEMVYSIYANGEMDCTKKGNDNPPNGEMTFPQTVEPIPNNKTNSKPNNKTNNKTSSKKFADDDVQIILAKKLYKLMLKNNPKAKEPNFDKWALDIDKLIRINERTQQEILDVINYSQQNDFWRSNILSAKKLREKFDTLYLQAKRSDDSGGYPNKEPINTKVTTAQKGAKGKYEDYDFGQYAYKS